MANERVLFDKTEVMLTIVGKNRVSVLNVTYDKLITVQFEPIKEFKFFRMVPSEQIKIKCSGREQPVIYKRSKEKKYFDAYKAGFRKFCKENRITFYDYTTET